jgi:1-acyl-sn-glycerol-3-phosphate acyltransferase
VVTRESRRDAISEADLRRFEDALGAMSMWQGRVERLLRAIFRAWCRFVSWDLDVEGMDSLPRRGGRPAGAGSVVAVAPHRAWVEPFLLFLAWPADAARLVWLADGRTVTRSRWRRWLLPRLGLIPIRGVVGGPRAYAALAAVALDAGAALVVFPETGSPSTSDRTRATSPGFAYLALGAGARVIPVVISGSHHIVRGSSFGVGALAALEMGPAVPDPFTPDSRQQAQTLARRYEMVINAALPVHNARTDAHRPAREQWTWLATLFD